MDEKEFLMRREQRKRRKKQMMRRRMIFFSVIILIVIIVSIVFAVKHNSSQENGPAPAPPTITAAPPASDAPQTSGEPEGSDNPQDSGAPQSPKPSATAEPAPSPTVDPALASQVVFPPKPEKPADILKGLNMDDGEKVAYLTFDDGPTLTVTPKILDTLRRYNVKATFFQVGSLIEENLDMARRVYDEGHLLANHSYAHNYSKLYATEDAFITEVEKTNQLIQKVSGNENYPKVFRFPGGGYNAGTWGANKQKYKEVLADKGVRYCDWNALNGDAEGGGNKTAAQLVERVKNTAKKEDIVILMHDAAAKKTTAEALPAVIEYLISQGYSFKRLDQA